MQLKLGRPLWGVTEPWETVFPRIKADFSIIEAPLPEPAERARFRALLDEHGLDYIALIFTSGASVDEYVETFRSQLSLAGSLRPILINSHSGFDGWDDESSIRFLEQALTIEADFATPVSHETHRGRILYNPWVTSRLLQRFPALRLCCDFSHWVCVCERLLDTETEWIQLAAEHCIHIHARVGYEEGPQVPDPRAPEYQQHLDAHERWWSMVWEAQRKRGMAVSTLTPEYGPPHYLHTLPYSQAPVADLWEITHWQARREATRFAEFMNRSVNTPAT